MPIIPRYRNALNNRHGSFRCQSQLRHRSVVAINTSERDVVVHAGNVDHGTVYAVTAYVIVGGIAARRTDKRYLCQRRYVFGYFTNLDVLVIGIQRNGLFLNRVAFRNKFVADTFIRLFRHTFIKYQCHLSFRRRRCFNRPVPHAADKLCAHVLAVDICNKFTFIYRHDTDDIRHMVFIAFIVLRMQVQSRSVGQVGSPFGHDFLHQCRTWKRDSVIINPEAHKPITASTFDITIMRMDTPLGRPCSLTLRYIFSMDFMHVTEEQTMISRHMPYAATAGLIIGCFPQHTRTRAVVELLIFLVDFAGSVLFFSPVHDNFAASSGGAGGMGDNDTVFHTSIPFLTKGWQMSLLLAGILRWCRRS
nr:MAG TPA: hypothetical protein [Caudoviricetes sp.]